MTPPQLRELSSLHPSTPLTSSRRALPTSAGLVSTTAINPEGQFKGVHYFKHRTSGCPRRPLHHDPLCIGLLAPKARKCRLLPIECALWKNRGLGKGRLSFTESPACEYSSQSDVSCGCGGGNLVPRRLRRQLARTLHRSQGYSKAWVGGISSACTTEHDEGQVLIDACLCCAYVLLLTTADRSKLR